jgi:hypothetical protein
MKVKDVRRIGFMDAVVSDTVSMISSPFLCILFQTLIIYGHCTHIYIIHRVVDLVRRWRADRNEIQKRFVMTKVSCDECVHLQQLLICV